MGSKYAKLTEQVMSIVNESIALVCDMYIGGGLLCRVNQELYNAIPNNIKLFRKLIKKRMKDRNTEQLDAHKIAIIAVLSVLKAKPIYFDTDKPTKGQRLCNELVALLAMRSIVRQHQIKDYFPKLSESERLALRKEHIEISFPEEIYDNESSRMNLLYIFANISMESGDFSSFSPSLMLLFSYVFYLLDFYSSNEISMLARRRSASKSHKPVSKGEASAVV